MKISGFKTFIVPAGISDSDWAWGKAFLLIKIQTDTGLIGWGEAFVPHDCEHAIDAMIKAIARYTEGTDPRKITEFRHNALNSFANQQVGFHLSCAIAGIEMALWDIAGKDKEKPVYQLLGGLCREEIPVYANCHSDKNRPFDDITAYAKRQVADGFLRVKVYPFLNGQAVEQGLADIEILRRTLGPNCEILVDAWRALDYDSALLACRGLEALGIEWLEDPIPLDDLESLSGITSSTTLDIVTGETLSQEDQFGQLLEKAAANVLNPDIASCGLMQIQSIAHAAASRSAKVAIHNFNSIGPALAASMHTAAVIPNLAGVEYFPRFSCASEQFCTLHWQHGADRSFNLSNVPGLGVTVDESRLSRYEYRPGPARPWPQR